MTKVILLSFLDIVYMRIVLHCTPDCSTSVELLIGELNFINVTNAYTREKSTKI